MIEFSISDLFEQKIELPNYSDQDFNIYRSRNEKPKDLIEEVNRQFSDHPVVKRLVKIKSPIFLGLDRRREESSYSDYYGEREALFYAKNKRSIRTRRLIKGSIGVSLMETEMLVQDNYRRLRMLEDKHSERLRNSILKSIFSYQSYDIEEGFIDMLPERMRLLERKREIKETLSNIGGGDKGLSLAVDKFFDQLTQLFESQDVPDNSISIELLLNKAQIESMASIVDIIDEHRSKIDRLFRPINNFLDIVNEFYLDSGKKLEVNAVGQLQVVRPGGTASTIEGLSSGERQLLVIFAHSLLNNLQQETRVFIIDEPELSLHLRWQEKFAETIFSIDKKSQYILATHSPEIVGERKHKTVKCR